MAYISASELDEGGGAMKYLTHVLFPSSYGSTDHSVTGAEDQARASPCPSVGASASPCPCASARARASPGGAGGAGAGGVGGGSRGGCGGENDLSHALGPPQLLHDLSRQ